MEGSTSADSERTGSAALLERFTIHFGHAAATREEMVLVPYGHDIAAGYAKARALLRAGMSVRLIGLGVTTPSARPSWVTEGLSLTVSELMAYRDRSTLRATADLRAAIEDWLDAIFGSSLRNLKASESLFSLACLRLFQSAIVAHPVTLGVARRHGGATIHVVGGPWIGTESLRALVEPRGGRILLERSLADIHLPWRVQMAAMGAGTLAVSFAEQSRVFWRSRRTRRHIAARRATRSDQDIDAWVVLVADWFRYNRATVDSVILPALQRGASLGFLLAGSLTPGVRNEENMRSHSGTELWTGLGAARDSLGDSPLEQVVEPETLSQFVVASGRWLRGSLRALHRAATYGPRVGEGGNQIVLSRYALKVALLATIDLARAMSTELATTTVLSRHDLRGKSVIMAGSQSTMAIIADRLNATGAQTIELAHGSIGTGEPGARQGRARVACVWGRADERALAPLAQRCIVAGMPLPPAIPARDRRTPSRVLLISNYLHNGNLIDGRQPLAPYQVELFRAVMVARKVLGENASIRWRPHPADEEASVLRSLARVRDVIQRSTSALLADDVAWSDIIISSPSSSLFEIILADVPVFMHVTPDYADTPAAFVEPSRAFFYAEELEAKLSSCVAALRRGDPEALGPERRTRVDQFGPEGVPQPLDAAVPLLRRERASSIPRTAGSSAVSTVRPEDRVPYEPHDARRWPG